MESCGTVPVGIVLGGWEGVEVDCGGASILMALLAVGSDCLGGG